MKKSILVSVVGIFQWSIAVAATPSTLDMVLKGKSCRETNSQVIECEYKVGKNLYINIAGVGQPDAQISFLRTDHEGDFYASLGIAHGCVIVKRGPKSLSKEENFSGPGSIVDFAFISPKNGKVYPTWEACVGAR